MQTILVLHGPNLNLLGSREPQIYASTSLEQLNQGLTTLGDTLGWAVSCAQTNAEHELINYVQTAKQNRVCGIILNAAAFAHTSIALRDALLAVKIPFIEVHISNTYAREEFRQKSYLSDIAAGVIIGLGPQGYDLALRALANILSEST